MKSFLLPAILIGASLPATAQISRYSRPAEQRIVNTYVPQNTELMRQALAARQAQHDQEAKACIQQTETYYAALGSHPAVTIGWHDATVINPSYGMCQEGRYYVDEQGVITNIQQSDGEYGPAITTGTRVVEGKGMYSRTNSETGLLSYFTVYFR